MKKNFFRSNNKVHKLILAVTILSMSFVVVMADVSNIYADETDKINNSLSVTNIGFMKNPPKKLKEKFPMCDAFLKVDWIDKEKKIGYSHYDLYRNGKKEKQKAFALIHIDESRPHYDYDLSVSEFEGVGKIGTKEVFSIIKKGKVFFNTNYLSILYDNDEKRLDFDTIACTNNTCDFTLFSNKINVCIPFPDNRRVWIAEGKQIDKVYSKEDARKVVEKIRKYVPSPFPLHGWNIGENWIIDINHDGIEDYTGNAKIVYSYGNTYYEAKIFQRDAHNAEGYYSIWSFPPTNQKCELRDPQEWVGKFFFTTDGKNIFLNNKCNLTELTQGGK